MTSKELKGRAEDEDISPLFAWSKSWRPLPYMDEVCPGEDGESWGGYLPAVDVCDAVIRTGWTGSRSYEVGQSSGRLTAMSLFVDEFQQVFYGEDMTRDDPNVPVRWIEATKKFHEMLVYDLKSRGY